MEGTLQCCLRVIHHPAAIQNFGTPTLGEIEDTLLEALEVFDNESVNAHGGRLVVGIKDGNAPRRGRGNWRVGSATKASSRWVAVVR